LEGTEGVERQRVKRNSEKGEEGQRVRRVGVLRGTDRQEGQR